MQNQSRAAPRRSHLSHTTAFVGIEKSWTAFVVTDSTANSPTEAGVSLVPVAPSPPVPDSMEARPSPCDRSCHIPGLRPCGKGGFRLGLVPAQATRAAIAIAARTPCRLLNIPRKCLKR